MINLINKSRYRPQKTFSKKVSKNAQNSETLPIVIMQKQNRDPEKVTIEGKTIMYENIVLRIAEARITLAKSYEKAILAHRRAAQASTLVLEYKFWVSDNLTTRAFQQLEQNLADAEREAENADRDALMDEQHLIHLVELAYTVER